MTTDLQPEATAHYVSLHEARVKLRAAAKEHSNSYLHMGAILEHIHTNKLWKGGYDSFVSFVRDEGLSRSWSYRCMSIYSRFRERAMGILPDRLVKIASLNLDADREELLLEDARVLNPGAFADQVRQLKGLMPSDGECSHPEVETRCRVCRKLLG